MTGKELLILSLDMIPEDDASDYEPVGVSCINVLLMECFNINNAKRLEKEKERLINVPFISKLTDTVEFENEVLYGILCYGLAAKLLTDETDPEKRNFFEAKYKAAKKEQCAGVINLTEDCYRTSYIGGGSDV